MLSLILPYWDRQAAADKALHQLYQTYPDLDMEVIVVDDGNEVPFVCPDTILNIRVIRLPKKSKPTPQSKAWNAGVNAARGEIIVLSCIEILHPKPILQEMVENLKKVGDKGYILASAWCPEEDKWHVHSTVHSPYVPDGTGAAFCSMMYSRMFYRVGGFDEDYHDGSGYEDKDFIQRMLKAGAKFVIRDDLTVTHPKSNATIKWSPEGFVRNREMYLHKWPHVNKSLVTFVCLKAGDAFGPEYVNILRDMVLRNTTDGYISRFVCITDDPTGLDEGIETLPLPDDLEQWWGKLYMFKRGLFPDGSRMVFMDLDTVITGQLDKIFEYQGQFATLRDFAIPDRLGPAIMLWEAGSYTASIWEEWVSLEQPRHPMGDLWWLNNLNQGRFPKEIDKLQDKFPGKFVSYKLDCQVSPPNTAAVVCFHGIPRPHQAEGWVKLFWTKGGLSSSHFEVVCNTEKEKIVGNIRYSSALGLPSISVKPENDRKVVFCGGGPSLHDSLDEIREWKAKDAIIVGMNGSAKFLRDCGIFPHWWVGIDARPENVRFLEGFPALEFFLASQCDKSLFDALKEQKTTIFHIDIPNIGEYVFDDGQPIQAIGGGSTVGLMALSLAYTQGYRDLHLYGYDSSFRDERGHAYGQFQNDSIVSVNVSGREFNSTPWMVTQVNQWQDLSGQLRQLGCNITVHGDGLLPYVAWIMAQQQLLAA